MTTVSSANPSDAIQVINKDSMKEVLDDYEKVGRKESGYVVVDVRGVDEVQSTGALSPSVYTVPLPSIGNALNMTEEAFSTAYGFDKPNTEETVVFTCRSGKRAMMAAEEASAMGFKKVLVYGGGAKEWFGI